MEDVIACLYPDDRRADQDYARLAIGMEANSPRRVAAPAPAALLELPGRNTRETTVSFCGENEPDEESDPDLPNLEGLQLTFTFGPKALPGFYLGTSRRLCDIVLPGLPNISRHHCFLGFDEKERLIVRDCSKNGTIVEYDGEGGEKRCNFTWIIGGHRVPDSRKTIVIELDTKLRFQILVSKPSCPATYSHNVKEFRPTPAETSLPLGALGIQSNASTAAPSGTSSPTGDPIFLNQEVLGSGSFATVYRVWNVSNGIEYASKRFFHRTRGPSDWLKEKSVMELISHENIVPLHWAFEEPNLELVLEYQPFGALSEQRGISRNEVIIILQQGLSALTYLHGRTPPIAHRDIKPANILVYTRNPLLIKLGDFGLSKASENFNTFCGTKIYMAPELHIKPDQALREYSCAVDIWSFGLVILKYIYNLPPGDPEELRWCRTIVEHLNACHARKPDGLTDLLLNMLVMDPQERISAAECLARALQLPVDVDLPSTPRPVQPYAAIAQSIEETSTLEPNQRSMVSVFANRAPQATRGPVGISQREGAMTPRPFTV